MKKSAKAVSNSLRSQHSRDHIPGMLLERDLQLVTPILATKMNNTVTPPRREFVKDKTEDGVQIRNDLARWNWAFLEARDALNLQEVAVAAIIPCATYFTKNTSTYWRSFRRGRDMMKEAFEAVSSGRVAKFKFTLSQHIPPNCDGSGRFQRPPSEEEFDSMLAHIGEHLGMSEWGHAYLYGRFVIKQINNETNLLHSKI